MMHKSRHDIHAGFVSYAIYILELKCFENMIFPVTLALSKLYVYQNYFVFTIACLA